MIRFTLHLVIGAYSYFGGDQHLPPPEKPLPPYRTEPSTPQLPPPPRLGEQPTILAKKYAAKL